MTDEILDLTQSLTTILEEETEKLTAPGRHRDLGELASAKGRLVGALESLLTQRKRQNADWVQQLDADVRTDLAARFARLQEIAEANGRMLRRQIELSSEMMAAVAAEAQRLTGTSNSAYGMHGLLFRAEQATPISLNARI